MKNITQPLNLWQYKKIKSAKNPYRRQGSRLTKEHLAPQFLLDPVGNLFYLLTYKERKALGSMLFVALRTKRIFAKHKTIAQWSDTSVSTTQRVLNKLKELKLVSWDTKWIARNVNAPCEYYFNEFLLQQRFVNAFLGTMTKSLLFISFLAACNPAFHNSDRDNKNKDIYIINLTTKIGIVEATLREYMNNEREKLTCYALQELCKAFPLTPHGMAKAAAYPPAAIAFATTQVSKALLKEDPWEYLLEAMHRYCFKLEDKPNWSIYETLKRGFNVHPEDTTFIDQERLNKLRSLRNTPIKSNLLVSQPRVTPPVAPPPPHKGRSDRKN